MSKEKQYTSSKASSSISYTEHIQALNHPTLEFRRQRADVIQVYKILKESDKVQYPREYSISGNALFKPSLSRTTHGHNQKLQIQHQPNPMNHFLTARATNLWNNLGQETVDALSQFLQVKGGERMDRLKFDYVPSY